MWLPRILDRAGYLDVAVVLLVVGVVVARRARGDAGRRWFSAFLIAVGGNFAAEFWAGVVEDPVASESWRRLGLVLLVIDPLLLLLAVRAVSAAPGYPRWVLGFTVTATAAWLLVVARRPSAHVPDSMAWTAFVAYFAIAYATALAVIVRDFAVESSAAGAARLRPMVLAVAVSVIPRLAYVPQEIRLVPSLSEAQYTIIDWSVVSHLLALVAGGVAFVAWANRAAPPTRVRSVRSSLRPAVAFLGAVALVDVGIILLGPGIPPNAVGGFFLGLGRFIGPGTVIGRWFVAAFFLLQGLARESGPKRESLRFAAASGSLLGAATGAAVVPFAITIAEVTRFEWNSLGYAARTLVLGGAVGVGAVAGRATFLGMTRAHGAGPPSDATRLDLYKAALSKALGDAAESDPRHLAALQDLYGITPMEHHLTVLALRSPTGPAAPSNPIATGSVVAGRFRLDALLGQGASGRTYRALDLATGERIALKHLALTSGGAHERISVAFVLDAARVGRATHPNAVRVHGVHEDSGQFFLAMELVDGGDLARRVRAGPIAREDAVRLVLDVLRGLAWLHASGIVHRDLKPSNVLLASDGRAKIADFGTASRTPDLDATVSALTAAFQPGTVAYMAPEQARGAPSVGPAADLYGVAAIAYELLAGKRYLDFAALSDFEARERILHAPPRLPAPDLPRDLNAWLARGLSKEPERRFRTAEEMAKALVAATGVTDRDT